MKAEWDSLFENKDMASGWLNESKWGWILQTCAASWRQAKKCIFTCNYHGTALKLR